MGRGSLIQRASVAKAVSVVVFSVNIRLQQILIVGT
jgi:hypothetical protein